MPALPCFLCGSRLGERIDKNGKPYFICDPCGIQLWVRRKNGIEKLRTLMSELETQEIHLHARSPEFLHVLAILNEISAIKNEIRKIDNDVFLFASEQQSAARNAFQKQIDHLVAELQLLGAQEDSEGVETQ